MIAIEVESEIETDDWTILTDVEGFSGEGFYRWDGNNFFSWPAKGYLRYEVEVTNPGDYQFRIHNYHGFPRPDEHNDVWLRINETNWIKIYNHVTFRWNWVSFPENGHEHPGWNTLRKGMNLIELAGRSNGFAIDRFHLYNPLMWTATQAEDISLPLSPITRSGKALSARFVAEPNIGFAPLNAKFDLGLVSVPEGRSVAAVEWKLGDRGAVSTEPSVDFQYDMPGDYLTQLTITDDLGEKTTYETIIHVTSGVDNTLAIRSANASDRHGGDRVRHILDESEKTRWSTDLLNAYAEFDLGGKMQVEGVRLAFFKGDERVYKFDVLISPDGLNYQPLLENIHTSGKTEDYVSFRAESPQRARFVRVVGRGNTENNFTQITRARVLGQYIRQGWLRHAEQVEDWLLEPTFGWISLADYPQVYHAVHGWLFVNNHQADETWLFNLVSNSWTYVDPERFPWVFSPTFGSWVYVTEWKTESGLRWMYVNSAKNWIQN